MLSNQHCFLYRLLRIYYVTINSYLFNYGLFCMIHFTFHYVTINSTDFAVAWCHLIIFTFHYVTINSLFVTEPIAGNGVFTFHYSTFLTLSPPLYASTFIRPIRTRFCCCTQFQRFHKFIYQSNFISALSSISKISFAHSPMTYPSFEIILCISVPSFIT